MATQPRNIVVSREPGERAQDLPSYLYRILPIWGRPGWLEGPMWRKIARSQMVAMICRDTLAFDLLSLDWKIVDVDSQDPNQYSSEIKYHTRLFSSGYDGLDYSGLVEWFMQDLTELPFGFGAEVGREGDQPDGKVLWIHPLDGATLFPTLDYNWPVGQMVPGYAVDPVYFPRHGIIRAYMTPRTELAREGYGMAPPEKIYLALELLSRGDVYYANLLLDTPSAGILDLGDMEENTAKSWLQSWQTLMTGVDAFKVPVLYEHTTQAKFISFGRPPTEIMFDTTTMKYAALIAAGYGLTLEDLGLSTASGNGGNTLAGTIRSERRSKKAGKAVVKRKFKAMMDQLLPPYLEFKFIDFDDEATVSTGRARLASAQAFKLMQDAGQIVPDEARQQAIQDGLFTINMPDNVPEGATITPSKTSGITPARDQLGRPVTPSMGGHGEITPNTKSRAGQALEDILSKAMGDAVQAATSTRIRRLIRAAVKLSFNESRSVLNELLLSDVEDPFELIDNWNDFYSELLFDATEDADITPEIILSTMQDKQQKMKDLLESDPWWKTLAMDQKEAVLVALTAAFQVGMQDAANRMVGYLYETGNINNSTPDVTAFDLRDPDIVAKLENFAKQIIDQTNDGTEYYLGRIALAEVNKALADPHVAHDLANGTLTQEMLFNNPVWMQRLTVAIQSAIIAIMADRASLIASDSDMTSQRMATVEMFKKAGLTKKFWQTTSENPCPQFCIPNQSEGFVPLDHVYKASWPEGVQQPQAHAHCACYLRFDNDELVDVLKSGKFKVWNGE